MKLFNLEFGGKKELPLPQIAATQIGNDRYSFNTRKNFSQIVNEGVYQNAAVQGCLSAYAMTLNEAPLTVTKNEEQITDHPLAKLFRHPNPHMSGAQLFAFIATYIGIGGNCYLIKTRNGSGVPVELYPYHSGQITAVRGEREWINYYLYDVNGVTIKIDPSDVVHFRSHLIDPLKPQEGMSPILAAARGTDTYNELAKTIYSVLKNDTVVTGILSTAANAPALTSVQVASLQEQMRAMHSSDSPNRTLVASGGMDYRRIGLALNELEAVETFSQAEVAICQAFRVHPLVAMTYAGLLHSTYSNMTEAFKQFTTLFRIPTWNLWEEQIENSFRKEFPDVEVEFDLSEVEALQPEAGEYQAQVVAQYQGGIITQNEARTALGYEPLSGGNAVNTPHSIAPPIKSYKSEESDSEERVYKGEVVTEEKGFEYYTKVNDVNDNYADAIAKAFSKVASELEKEVVANVKGEPFNYERWKKKFITGTHEARMAMINDLIKQSLDDIDLSIGDFGDDFDAVQKLSALESSGKIAQSIGTIRDELRELLSKSAHLTDAELTELIKSTFETIKAARAAMIGRTTATSITGTTQKTTWQRYNKREPDKKKHIKRIWYTTLDRNARESHMGLSRVYEKYYEEYQDSGWVINGKFARYPADSNLEAKDAVNCRCVTIPTRAK